MAARSRRLLKRFRLHATPCRVFVERDPRVDGAGVYGYHEDGTITLNSDNASASWDSTYGHESAHLIDHVCDLHLLMGWDDAKRELFASLVGPVLIDWLRAHGGRVPRKPK